MPVWPAKERAQTVLISGIGESELRDGLVYLDAKLNGETVVLAFTPHTGVTGIQSVQLALYKKVIPWPGPRKRPA